MGKKHKLQVTEDRSVLMDGTRIKLAAWGVKWRGKSTLRECKENYRIQVCWARRLSGGENKDAKYAWESRRINDHLEGRMGCSNVTWIVFYALRGQEVEWTCFPVAGFDSKRVCNSATASRLLNLNEVRITIANILYCLDIVRSVYHFCNIYIYTPTRYTMWFHWVSFN